MHSFKRIFVGLVTSLLLSAGWVAAAEKIDGLVAPVLSVPSSPQSAPNCTSPCSWVEE